MRCILILAALALFFEATMANAENGVAIVGQPAAEVDCTGVLGNPLVRAASVQAVAEMRRPSALQNLSEQGVRSAVLTRIRDIVYNRNELFARRYADQVRVTSTVTAETCLPDLMPLMVDVRKSIDEQNKRLIAEAKEAARPENQLYTAYRRYAFVKGCYQLRQGYAMIYITEAELNRAREKIEGIEKDALTAIKGEDFNTTALFDKAVSANNGLNASYEACHIELRNLINIKSTTGNFAIEKDF